MKNNVNIVTRFTPRSHLLNHPEAILNEMIKFNRNESTLIR